MLSLFPSRAPLRMVQTSCAMVLALFVGACSADSRDDLAPGAGDPQPSADDTNVGQEPGASQSGADAGVSPSVPEPDKDDDAGAAASTDAGTDAGDPSKPPADPGSVDDIDAFAKTALARAMQWVDVKMPYCGGVNHGKDWLCDGTCERTGKHATPEWDPYRTDCSGFVSWSWQVAPPGWITTDMAPFNKANTTVIAVNDLRPGDALNNETHIILFGGWANKERTKARLLEEYNCGEVAVDRIRSISKATKTEVDVPGSGRFWAIRLDSRP